MSTHGRDNSDSPDVTARVMQRLGYVQADEGRARKLRRRTAMVRVFQGLTVLSAVVLGAVWWFGGGVPAQSSPAVVDSLRGSFARGTSQLDGFFAALPRPLPRMQSPVADGTDFQPPSASLENAPQLRSY